MSTTSRSCRIRQVCGPGPDVAHYGCITPGQSLVVLAPEPVAMLFGMAIFRSWEKWATVTFPGLAGCPRFRCDPPCPPYNQPSAFSVPRISMLPRD
jgi:hypothetical protein